MIFEAPKNINYCATIVRLNTFVPLVKGDGGLLDCGNVKGAIVRGSQVIVNKETPGGAIGVFFPPECALSHGFLSNNNLYRKTEFGNLDPTKVGFFEQHGRVRTMKFRGHKSEGFWIPLESLAYLGIPLEEFVEGTEFDSVTSPIDGDLTIEICKKYIPKYNRSSNPCTEKGSKSRKPRAESLLVRGQFQFHIDTSHLKRNIHRLQPHMVISVSEKWHGTSAIFANILTKRELSWAEQQIVKRPWLNKLIKVQETEYGVTWASRKVVKGVAGQSKPGQIHYYGSDIWAHVMETDLNDKLPKGHTIYGEIVGFKPEGGAIQGGYHYGCGPGEHKFLIYRITSTNEDGKVIEFTWSQMKQFCVKFGLTMVPELYHGQARHFGSDTLRALAVIAEKSGLDGDLALWQQAFLDELIAKYVYEQPCPHNDNAVPFEGIVVKVENHLSEPESYKLKSFAFNKRESDDADKGVIDIETIESEGGEEEVGIREVEQ